MTAPLKVGLMVPMNNTTMERELLAWLPAESTCATLRIPRGKGLLTAESIPEYKAQALTLAREFAAMDLDVVTYGCTAASFISGPAGDVQLARELTEITGKPVVTTAQSMVIALREANARDIALVTPYTDRVNTQIKAYLANSGVNVQRFNSFYAADVEALGRIQADEVARLAEETMDDACEAMFIACSQLPTYAILEGLRTRFGRPVWSSVQATAQRAMRAGRLQAA